MLKEITSGYKKFFNGFFKVFLLCLVCLGIGFVIVIPLWKWASASSETYSIVMLIVLAALFVFWIFRCCKKYTAKKVAFVFLKIFIILATLAGFIIFVLAGKKIIGFVVLIAGIAVFSVIAFGLNSIGQNNTKNIQDAEN